MAVALLFSLGSFYVVKAVSNQPENWVCPGQPYLLEDAKVKVGFPFSVELSDAVYGTCGTIEPVSFSLKSVFVSWQFYANAFAYLLLMTIGYLGLRKYAHIRH